MNIMHNTVANYQAIAAQLVSEFSIQLILVECLDQAASRGIGGWLSAVIVC